MGKNWAIAIGINQYRYLQPLHYAVRDAAAMCNYFSNESRFEQVYYFSDTSPPIQQDYGSPLESVPTFTTLKRFLRSRFERPFLQTGDNLWFFFAGHGIRHEDRDYLMPIDSDPGEVDETAIPISFVTDRLRRSGADNVVLLIDACRSEGRRAGVGVGEEVQQGVITLFSCSPRETSYEIETLQQGAFTHTLLHGLRLQGEGNCATVERLDGYLRHHVPELNRQCNKPPQTPYTTVEPAAKYHLILLPRQATVRDAEALKVEAYKAQTERAFELAEQLWIRVLAVSPADSDAILNIRRLPQIPTNLSAGSSRLNALESADTSGGRSTSTVANATDFFPLALSRRRWLQIAGLGGIGIGVASVFRFLKLPPNPKPFAFDVITVNDQGKETYRQRKQAQFFEEDLGREEKINMVAIEGGTFTMGSLPNEKRREDNQEPQRLVTVKAFWMGMYTVTQAQWKAVAARSKVDQDLALDPSKFKGGNLPVEQVFWQDAQEFCARLSEKTGRKYRLPSEAEWEYACRAGTTTPFHFGETITTNLVNYNGTYIYAAEPKGENRQRTTDVGSFPPNAFGLYDMHGNIWEWCLDHWHENYQGAPTDGSAWTTGGDSKTPVLRGGCLDSDPGSCRSAVRGRFNPVIEVHNFGFRVVCESV